MSDTPNFFYAQGGSIQINEYVTSVYSRSVADKGREWLCGVRWGILWEETLFGFGSDKVTVFYSSQAAPSVGPSESTTALQSFLTEEKKEGRVVLYEPYNTSGNAPPGPSAPKKPNP
jgi:hypothetical protein